MIYRFRTMLPLVTASLILSFTSCESDDDGGDSGSDGLSYSYPLVATGQSLAYDIDGEIIGGLGEGDYLYGQDAHYKKGGTMSYTDYNDETVTDNVTGLMWQKIPTTDEFTWEEAKEYCENLELGGYDDWRMPSAKELFSISDFSNGWPYLNINYFYLASGETSKDEQYWTNNLYVGVTEEGGDYAAFGVNHVTGHIKAYAAGMPSEMDGEGPEMGDSNTTPPPGDGMGAPTGNPMAKYVRAVRGNTYGINDFTDNGNATITDKATGLMWSQNDSGEGMEWADALSYAENSNLAGYIDWRLPNVKELQSIVDYTRSITATDPDNVGPAIDPLFNCTPIVSEAGYDDYAYYWTGTSAYFSPASTEMYYAWYVAMGRAVNDQGEDFHGAGAVRFDTKYTGGAAGEDAERYTNFVFLVRDAD
ncbi:DUF1566 domain-containing protein [Maribacter sp. ANRC-HE7]|uniref:DUF1566 domain-containing protein n=1 Tax=Maribacter aquimaris TaxID=2737171 RepID=A0ABR7V2U1_9FLAO|nr:DUF1566 domain-containing protein [Maribacter aquimaris]MBD0777621.1 DUF1566 domain-containing protein [Maribacter aquimaris]